MSLTRRSFLGWLGGAASAVLVAVGVGVKRKTLEPLMDPWLTDNEAWYFDEEPSPAVWAKSMAASWQTDPPYNLNLTKPLADKIREACDKKGPGEVWRYANAEPYRWHFLVRERRHYWGYTTDYRRVLRADEFGGIFWTDGKMQLPTNDPDPRGEETT